MPKKKKEEVKKEAEVINMIINYSPSRVIGLSLDMTNLKVSGNVADGESMKTYLIDGSLEEK